MCVCVLQIEELGSEGKVEEAQGMMKLVEQLKEERELLRSTTSVSKACMSCSCCGYFRAQQQENLNKYMLLT